MIKPFYVTTEEHQYESNAAAFTVYFNGNPTKEDVASVISEELGEDVDSEDIEKVPTPVSKKAGLSRWQYYGEF